MGIHETTDDGLQAARLKARLEAMKVATDASLERVVDLEAALNNEKARAAELAQQYEDAVAQAAGDTPRNARAAK